MKDYNGMSVHELVQELAEKGRLGNKRFTTPQSMMMVDRDAAESALRRAVAREASAGTWLIGDGDGIPAGYYDLIPKETT